jgi:hypothetical protein
MKFFIYVRLFEERSLQTQTTRQKKIIFRSYKQKLMQCLKSLNFCSGYAPRHETQDIFQSLVHSFSFSITQCIIKQYQL